MNEREHRDLVGHPSDYGSRGEVERTADGEPLDDRGSAASAISHEQRDNARGDDLQGDTDFDQTNADGGRLLEE